MRWHPFFSVLPLLSLACAQPAEPLTPPPPAPPPTSSAPAPMRCEAPPPSASPPQAPPAEAQQDELTLLRIAAKLAGDACKDAPARAEKAGCEAALAWGRIERLGDPQIIPTLLVLLEDQKLSAPARLYVLHALDRHSKVIERDAAAARRLVAVAQVPAHRASDWWPLANFVGNAVTSAPDVTASIEKLFALPASSVFMSALMAKAVTRDPARFLPQLRSLAEKPLDAGTLAAIEVLGQSIESPPQADMVGACRLLQRIILDRRYPREARATAADGARRCAGLDPVLGSLLTWARREPLGEGGTGIIPMLTVLSTSATHEQRKKTAAIAQAILDNRNNDTLTRVFALELLLEVTSDKQAVLARLASEPEPAMREKIEELKQSR